MNSREVSARYQRLHWLPQPAQAPIDAALLSIATTDKIICSIVSAELFYGAYKSHRRVPSILSIENFLAGYPNLDFDAAAARIFGELRADLERKGTPIGPYDLQIVAIALSNHLTLVTHNTAEFSRVPNLLWEDREV